MHGLVARQLDAWTSRARFESRLSQSQIGLFVHDGLLDELDALLQIEDLLYDLKGQRVLTTTKIQIKTEKTNNIFDLNRDVYGAQMVLNLVLGLVGLVQALLERVVHQVVLIPHVVGGLLQHVVRHVDVLVGLGSLGRRAANVVLGELGPRVGRGHTFLSRFLSCYYCEFKF